MSKIDFKKELKQLYGPPTKEFVLVDVPPMHFLMIDGHGDPNTAQIYTDALETLYGVAYKIKFLSKKTLARDYVVPPLEGLWWAEDTAAFSDGLDKDAWDWTMMIMQPAWIDSDLFDEALEQVRKKNLPSLPYLRLETYHEGLSVQIMHLGSYDDEGPTLQKMHHKFIPLSGYEVSGKHHEIYLSDPRRVLPEKLKTVLRQPVRRITGG